MADIKTLQTRIALKYDSYDKWTSAPGKDLVLLKGEIGICAIETKAQGAQTAPTVLFKVGDGEHKFYELNWASALAADVYDWAKAETVVLTEKTERVGEVDVKKQYLEFKTGENVKYSVDLSNFATEAEVKAITDPLAARILALESAVGTDDGSEESVSTRLSEAERKLTVLNGDVNTAGSVAKAIADESAVIKTAYEKYADDAEADAISAVDTKYKTRIEDLETFKADYKDIVDGNVDAIEDINEKIGTVADGKTVVGLITEAETAINNKIGTVAADKTVVGLIEAAQDAADDAQAAVDALVADNGQVTINKADIAQLKDDVSGLDAAINDEGGLDDRIEAIEAEINAFFKDAVKDGEGVQNALDTLVEIQNFLSSEEGGAIGEMVADINENAAAIGVLEGVVGGEDGKGGLVKDAADAKANISALQDDVGDLQKVVAGYEAEGSIKTAVDAAAKAAADAQKDLDALELIVGETAESGLRAAVAKNTGDISALAGVVGNAKDGLVADVATNATNIAELADEFQTGGRVTVAEADIDALEAIVVTGNDSNAKLRTAIGDLEAIVVSGNDSNAKLRTEIGRVAALIETENTGLAAKVTDHASRLVNVEDAVGTIQEDYLKMEDLFIIDCGSSTVNTHVRPAQA